MAGLGWTENFVNTISDAKSLSKKKKIEVFNTHPNIHLLCELLEHAKARPADSKLRDLHDTRLALMLVHALCFAWISRRSPREGPALTE